MKGVSWWKGKIFLVGEGEYELGIGEVAVSSTARKTWCAKFIIINPRFFMKKPAFA